MRRVARENFRVTIEPEEPWLIIDKSPEAREKILEAALRDIRAQILRHIDGVHDVKLEWDLVTVCDGRYGGVEGDGNLLARWPSCCTEDQIEFFQAHQDESDEWFAAAGMDDPLWLAELREGDAK